ncbi:hypothetical protein ES703_105501 [subsurface metagenome]
MPTQKIYVGKHVNSWLLIISLFLIFSGAVVASKFDSWYAIVGGAILAVVGCFINQASVKWVTDTGIRKRWFNIFW